MSINLHFDEEKRAGIEQAWTEWWAGELRRPIVVMRGRAQRLHWDPKQLTEKFFLDTPAGEVLDYFQPRLENVCHYADSLPTFGPYFGSGLGTAFLGGNVTPKPEERTVWFESEETVPFEELNFTHDPNNIWWRRVLDITNTAIERWGDKITICDIVYGGIIDLLGNFRKMQQLLYDLNDYPDEVIRVTNDIADIWIRYYDEAASLIEKVGRGTSNWGNVWSPGRTFMHESDFIYMISVQMFERFVLPNLDRCFQQMDHSFFHLDGEGAIRHLDIAVDHVQVMLSHLLDKNSLADPRSVATKSRTVAMV
ncbi:MAG: hypothetical protein QGG73_03015 [Candidatus Hydrogenedentes bacterium]|nr:hypothetical protein [Candidatus Hydrogenedentota bacterium]